MCITCAPCTFILVCSYISYPRTETNTFPQSFDLQAIVRDQTGDPNWGGTRVLCVVSSNRVLSEADHFSLEKRSPWVYVLVEKLVLYMCMYTVMPDDNVMMMMYMENHRVLYM